MKRQVRILSVLLALLLCCSSFPIVGSAQEALLYECEGQLGENHGIGVTEVANASGGKKVNGAGNNGAHWFTMTGITVSAAGLYTLEVDYTACADGRTFRVGVNGIDGAAGILVKASQLDTWEAIGTATTKVYLNEGENTLKFYSVAASENLGDSEWCPDFDCIRLTPLSLEIPTDGLLYECEASTTQNHGTNINNVENASGGQYVGATGNDGASWFTMQEITVPAPGNYLVEIDYISSDFRTFRIGANGAEGNLVSPLPIGNWTDIGTTSTVLTLHGGSNSLKFYTIATSEGLGDTQWAPNFDCIRIKPIFEIPADGLLYECEKNFIQGKGTGRYEVEGLSGGGKVGAVGNNGAHWFMMTGIVVPAAGEYTLEVDYLCLNDRTFRVSANGGEGVLVNAAALAEATAVGTATTTVTLQQGSNTLKFYSIAASEGLGDSEWCPDFDCIRIKTKETGGEAPDPTPDARAEDIAAVDALINNIGEVTAENYTTAITAIEVAESALANLVAAYGEEVRSEVTNAAVLTAARDAYNAYYFAASLPELTDGYRLYEAEANTSVFNATKPVENEPSSGGQSVGPISANGTASLLMQGITVPADGVYLVEVFYSACVEAAGRTFRIGVNGEEGELIVATGGLEDPHVVGMISVPLSLKEGANSLLFYGEETSLKLGDSAYGPDIDCIKVYEDPNVARTQTVSQVIALIDAIEAIDETNFLSCLPALQAAEAAMAQLEAVYGTEIRSEVTNYDALIAAREDYDYYNQPGVMDAYIVYECENPAYTTFNGAGSGVNGGGAGVVNSIRPNGATSFTMSIEIAEAGWYEMVIGYVNGGDTRICNLEINGKPMTIYYPNGGDWNSTAVVYLSAELAQGVNTFTFATPVTEEEYAAGEGYGPDFDYLGIMELPFSSPIPQGTVIGASTAALTSGLVVEEDAFALDGKRIVGLADSSQKVSYTLTIPSDGFYRIGVEASSIDADGQSLKLALSGSDITLPSVTIDGGCSLSLFSYLTTGVELKAGEYTLEISGTSNDISVGSVILAEFTREELMSYQATQIRNAIKQLGLISAGNYVERAAQVDALIVDLAAFDAEYGEEGKSLISESSRTTLTTAKADCEKYAEADTAADAIIAQIDVIGEITADNYKDKLVSIEAAEKAMSDYLTAYGTGCKGFVENYETLVQAREAYDAFSSYILGDINGDSNIDASDALLALQHSVKLTTLEGAKALAADTNHDGDINASDALLILQYSVKLITEFPSAS